MKTIIIKGKLINLDKIHFVRRLTYSELLVSFGTDFLTFTGTSEQLDDIFNEIQFAINEEFSDNHKRKRVLDQ